MKLPVNRVTGILNGFFNPLLLCAFLPIIEGAPGLDLTSPTGFWGQLIVATDRRGSERTPAVWQNGWYVPGLFWF